MNSGQRLAGFCFGLACITIAQILGKMTPEFLGVVGPSIVGWVTLKTVENRQYMKKSLAPTSLFSVPTPSNEVPK
jgi:hypothetical protein